MSNFQLDTIPQPLHGDHWHDLSSNGDVPHTTILSSSNDKVDTVAAAAGVGEFDAIDAIQFCHNAKTKEDLAARAGMEQNYLIPLDGEQPMTTKWEKYMFMVFRTYIHLFQHLPYRLPEGTGMPY
jgi:hypothetical protein